RLHPDGIGEDHCRMILLRAIFAAVILTASLPLRAGEIPLDQRRSGYSFMAPDTQKIQGDETANPGMLWVLDGEALWNKKDGTAAKSCADCHGDGSETMKAVAARYPAFDTKLGAPVDLEQRINLERERHQGAQPFTYESPDLLALTAFVARQSRGAAIAAG